MDQVRRLESGGKKVVKFSVTGYSFGGLVARYLVGFVGILSFAVPLIDIAFF
jgi:hypothetical protein